MHHDDFWQLLSKYKFAIAFENAVCEDYITEKLWRPLILGTIPIYYGSPSVEVSLFIFICLFCCLFTYLLF
jgi:alpha-1,3-fucosyltransferase 10